MMAHLSKWELRGGGQMTHRGGLTVQSSKGEEELVSPAIIRSG